MCKTIKQKIHCKAPPDVIYSLLTDSKKYASLTGKKLRSERLRELRFQFMVGKRLGIIVELVRNKRIVQAWRGHSFPEGIFSMATFNLKPTAKNGTELVLIHRGVPKEMIPSIEAGWRTYNWDKIKSYLETLN